MGLSGLHVKLGPKRTILAEREFLFFFFFATCVSSSVGAAGLREFRHGYNIWLSVFLCRTMNKQHTHYPKRIIHL